MSSENFVHKTFIIIVSYNAMPWIQKCLDSCDGWQVVIVDNNSTDGTVGYIKEHFQEIKLLEQSKNLGFGQANNLGISYALERGADYIFLLNQDAYLQQGCLDKLISIQKNNPDYGILSPVHLNGNGDRLDKNFSTYVAYPRNPDFYSDFVLKKPLQDIYKVPFVNAAGWLLSKDIIETVGGFDPIFFHYGEDDNYCQRAKYHGFIIGVVPIAFLQHDREDRKHQMAEIGSIDFFKRMERSIKVKYGNLNVENIEELKTLVNKRKRNKWKATLKMKFSHAIILNKEITMLTKLIPEIQKSRELNKKKQDNYLKKFSS